MPRHRSEREPRHRARRADRRVPVDAVSPRPPSHRKPATGPQLGKALETIGTETSGRLAAAGSRLRREQRDLLTGAVRGLIVSPWFAAGAGFVIAAGAFIYAPHARLDFGAAIGTSQCPLAGCHQQIEQGAPPMIAGTGDGPVTASPSSTPHSGRSTLAASATAPTFTYIVNWHAHGMFQMVLTVTSRHAIGNWQLAFVIPGATRVSVTNATWHRSGTDGGTASGTGGGGADSYAGSRDDPSFGPSPSAGPEAGRSGGRADQLSLVINGYGAPAAPSDSFYNGVACHFSQG
jgi:hypothetical protein